MFGISKVALFFVPIMGVATPLLEADTHQQTKHSDEFNVIIEYIYIIVYEPPQKTPAILNMYWTDIGLWKLMEIVKNTR
jgi:hypothetical protein